MRPTSSRSSSSGSRSEVLLAALLAGCVAAPRGERPEASPREAAAIGPEGIAEPQVARPAPPPAPAVPAEGAWRRSPVSLGGTGTYVLEPVLVPARPDPAASLPPGYPRIARFRGEEGLVVVAARVGPEGAVREVRVEASSGSGALDEAAAEAVARWRFVPARFGDRAVEDRVLVPVRFRLE